MRCISVIFTILILLSGCSGKQPLELVRSSVEISDDRSGGIGITSGEKEGEYIQPITLSYQFVLKNIGEEILGGNEKLNNETFEYEDGIKVYIEPNEKLREISKDVMGFNIYSESERKEAKMGSGKQSIPILQPNQEGEYYLDFDLGASEENPEIRLAPPQEQLDRLMTYAQEASLVIYIENEEIARFDLSQNKE
ncbi:hypothetical protein FGG79_03755 [Bacillus sp. BHET2]|uniref:hypothetical protein n=1 Tax=Bacillus sp. BHET2 TaxID=2583818 RepID=UPI00110DF3F3|nr:hypothetical protein [Bacillus sp. BHET2]TMU87255.1 hypothetical protein FGG79_03755 [Bacillus sp. BHET2]